ncbi:aldehyde dehydrogenase family protein, partial [Paraburkholderia sp. SIMBA_049]
MNAIRKPELGSAAKLFLAKPQKMLIDGKWVDALSGETLPVEDPATEEVITRVPAGNKADVDRAVEAARRALETGPWGRLSPADRSKLIWRLGDLLEKHLEEFAEIESLDNGKPLANARRDDVPGAASMFHYMAGWPQRLSGETLPVSSEPRRVSRRLFCLSHAPMADPASFE